MSQAAQTPTTEPGPRRRWPRRLGGILLVGLALLVVGYLTRGSHLHPWLITQAEDFVRERWGAELRVAEFDCDWVRNAELRGVELRADAPVGELGGLVSAQLDQLEIEFSPLELLRGAWPARVRGAGLRVTFDPRAAELSRGDQEDPGEAPGRRLPAIEFSGIELTALLDGERAVLTGGAIALEPGDWDHRDALVAGLQGQLELELGTQALQLLELLGLTGPTGPVLEGEPHVALRATLAAGQLTFETAQADWAGVGLTLEHGTATLTPLTLDLDLALQAEDLALIGAALGDEPWDGAARGGLHVSGTWPDIGLTAALEGDAILAAGHPIGGVELGLQLAAPGLNLGAATGST